MSAVIQNEYTGNNSTSTYSFTFPYLKTSDIKASLDGVDTTAFTLPNATTLQFNTAPGSGVKIKIFRQTSVDDLTATFYAGSAIKSEDLNDNFTQNLYKTQEVGARFVSKLGSTMTGDLTMGAGTDIVFEGATDDAHETTLTVADPTADRTITIPNVTGNVVTTGDTGTVARGMIAADAINNSKLADDAVQTENIVDLAVDATKIATGAIIHSKLANNSVQTENIVDGTILSGDLANNAVIGTKIATDAVNGSKIADDSIDSEHYVNGSIDNEHLANNSVSDDKIANNAITTRHLSDDCLDASHYGAGTVDATALASNSVTNVKLADDAVGTSEIVNDAVTTNKIATNAVTTAKIADDAIVAGKIADGAVDAQRLAVNAVTETKIADGEVTGSKLNTGAVTEAKISNNAVTTNKIIDDAVTTNKIQDSELKTLAGMRAATASKLAASTDLTADIADLNQIDGLTKQTTISDSDASFPTSGAVVDYVAAQLAPIGGFEAIATEQAFPNTQPQSGVVISIADAGGLAVSSTGTASGQTVGGTTVNITGIATNFRGSSIAAGVRLLVTSTGSGQNYTYHKATLKEDDLVNLSGDINDFNERYRVGSSNPTSSLDNGDLFFNTSTGKLLVYNGTNTAWEEAQSIGNFFISTLSPAFNGSVIDFTLSNAPTNVQQVILSINGVIQKPNAGTGRPSEGFSLNGSTIQLPTGSAPATGDSYFAVVMGSTVNIGTPSNNTVSSGILQNGSVITSKIADDAVNSDKLASSSVGTDALGSQVVTTANLANSAVGTSQIADGAVTALKMADNAIGTAEIADNAVTTAKIPDDAVTTAKIAKPLDFADNELLRFGGGNDMLIKHNGSHSTIENFTNNLYIGTSTSGQIILQKQGGDALAKFISGGAVELYHNNSKKLHTQTNGVTVTGYIQMDGTEASAAAGNIYIEDNGKAVFGNGSDLQLYHAPNNNYIESGSSTNTVDLNVVNGGNFTVKTTDNEYMLRAIKNGQCELYYNNSKKLYTDDDGVVVGGPGYERFKIDGQVGDLILASSGAEIQYTRDSENNITCTGSSSSLKINLNSKLGAKWFANGAAELYHNNNKKLETTSTGVTVTGNVSGSLASNFTLVDVDAYDSSTQTSLVNDQQWYTDTGLGTRTISNYQRGQLIIIRAHIPMGIALSNSSSGANYAMAKTRIKLTNGSASTYTNDFEVWYRADGAGTHETTMARDMCLVLAASNTDFNNGDNLTVSIEGFRRQDVGNMNAFIGGWTSRKQVTIERFARQLA